MADLFDTSVDYLIGATDIERRYEYVTENYLNSNELRVMEKYRDADDYGKQTAENVLDISIQVKKSPDTSK